MHWSRQFHRDHICDFNAHPSPRLTLEPWLDFYAHPSPRLTPLKNPWLYFFDFDLGAAGASAASSASGSSGLGASTALPAFTAAASALRSRAILFLCRRAST